MAANAAVYGGDYDDPNQTQKLKFNHPLGSKAMLSFGGVKRSRKLVISSFDQEEFGDGDEYLDEYLNQQEKKRRLTVDQVQFLERSFEADNKLEPQRKIHLANELGLQPRQIAVWFQNRRARWKTKHLETDYETLHASYETLKTDYDDLLKENAKLNSEVLRLKQNSLGGDTEKANFHEGSKVSALAFKNEEQSSARSEVTNVDSPRLSDGIHSPRLESGVTSHGFGPDYSDSSQYGEDNLHEELLQPDHAHPMIEDAHRHPPLSSFNYGFPVEDHAFNFWSY